jgi:hypothetical protein
MNKVLKFILVLFVGLSLYSCECDCDYKYLIYDNHGNVYQCNFYNENEDGCILFNDTPGENNDPGTPTIICGNYTIVQNK